MLDRCVPPAVSCTFKVSMAYHPTNMTISLLPVISDDGRELHWENQGASVSYIMDIDQVNVT